MSKNFSIVAPHLNLQQLRAVLPLIENDPHAGLSWLGCMGAQCNEQKSALNNVFFEHMRLPFLDQAVNEYDWAYVQDARTAFSQGYHDPVEARDVFNKRVLTTLVRQGLPLECFDKALECETDLSTAQWIYLEPLPANKIYAQWLQAKVPHLWQEKVGSKTLLHGSAALAWAAQLGEEPLSHALATLPLQGKTQADRKRVSQMVGSAWKLCLTQQFSQTAWEGVINLARSCVAADLTRLETGELEKLGEYLALYGLDPAVKKMLENCPLHKDVDDLASQHWGTLTQFHAAGLNLSAIKVVDGQPLLHAMASSYWGYRVPLAAWCLLANPELLNGVDAEGQSLWEALEKPSIKAPAGQAHDNITQALAQMRACALAAEVEAVAPSVSTRPRRM